MPISWIDTTPEPSWQIVNRFRNWTVVALRELPPERMLAVHDRIMRRVQSIIERGQHSGDFRTDLPTSWLVAVAVNLMHLAATETASGRVSSDEVPERADRDTAPRAVAAASSC